MKTLRHGDTCVIANAIESVTLVNHDTYFVTNDPEPFVLEHSTVTIHTRLGGIHTRRFAGAAHRGAAETCYQGVIEAIT
jgi:hypothetical protein